MPRALLVVIAAALLLSAPARSQSLLLLGAGGRGAPAGGGGLPATNKTFHADAADTDRLWKEVGMTNHPADTESVVAWDDEADATTWFLKQNGAAPPSYCAAGLNSLGCVRFDGTNDALRMRLDDDSAFVAISNIITNSAYTIFVAFRMEGDASNNAGAFNNDPIYGDTDGYMGLVLKTDTGVHTLNAFNYDGSEDISFVTISQSTNYVAMIKHVGGNLSINVNNGALTDTDASGNTSVLTGSLQVGTTNSTSTFANVKIGEIIIYNADVTGTDLSDAWTFLMAKWVP